MANADGLISNEVPAPWAGSAIQSRPAAAGADWTGWLTPGRFVIVLGLLIFALFAPVLCGWSTFYLRDFGYFSYPLAQYHRECFWRGELPLWNPNNLCGMPYLAQWNTLTLYPPSLVYLLLPLPWSVNLFCLLHLFAGGLGMYALAWRWAGQRFAAGAAGLLYVFNGFTLNCLMWPNNIAALGLMPWVVLLAQQAAASGGRRLLLAGLVGAVQMFSGAPEVILFTWLTAGAFIAADVAMGQAQAGRAAMRLAGVIVIVAGLSAAQLLPFLELLRASERTAAGEASYWPVPSWGWANFLVPLFRTARIPTGGHFQPGQEWIASYYTGVCGLVLAVTALARVRRARVWLLAGLAAASLLLAFGDNGFVYPLLRRLAPSLEVMRFPVKFLILFNFVLPLLAAFALARIASARWLVWPAGGALALIAGIVAWARWHPFPHEDWTTTLWSGVSRAVLLGGMFFALWLALRLREMRWRGMAGGLCLLLLVADGVTYGPDVNPTLPASALAPGLVRFDPASAPSGARVMLTRPAYDELYATMISDPLKDFLLHRQGLTANGNLLDGIPVADGFFSLYLREQRQFWVQLWSRQTNYAKSPVLDFMAVAQVNAPSSIFEWTNRPGVLPLATIGQQTRFANAATTMDALLAPDFRPREVVYLPPECATTLTPRARAEAEIRESQLTPHRLDFSVSSKTDTVLVVAQSHYAAWRALVDGRPAPILRANHAFQAVPVPAGAHRVVLEYHDRAFRLGVIVTVGTMLGVALLWLAWRTKALAQAPSGA